MNSFSNLEISARAGLVTFSSVFLNLVTFFVSDVTFSGVAAFTKSWACSVSLAAALISSASSLAALSSSLMDLSIMPVERACGGVKATGTGVATGAGVTT